MEEVAQLGAQLPLLVRGIYYEGWDPTGKPLKERHKEDFLAHVAREARTPTGPALEPEAAVRAVFKVLKDIQLLLPKGIREFWN